VEFLIDKGLKINSDERGMTPMHYAVLAKNIPIVKLLYDAKESKHRQTAIRRIRAGSLVSGNSRSSHSPKNMGMSREGSV